MRKMSTIKLVKEKSHKEMMEEKSGFIPVGVNIGQGTIGYNDGTFDIMLTGGYKLYFTFSEGERRISLDLQEVIKEAYLLAMGE